MFQAAGFQFANKRTIPVQYIYDYMIRYKFNRDISFTGLAQISDIIIAVQIKIKYIQSYNLRDLTMIFINTCGRLTSTSRCVRYHVWLIKIPYAFENPVFTFVLLSYTMASRQGFVRVFVIAVKSR